MTQPVLKLQILNRQDFFKHLFVEFDRNVGQTKKKNNPKVKPKALKAEKPE